MALDELNLNTKREMASNGEEGIMKLNLDPHNPPDYIFLDLNMPRMNGIECLREIRTMAHLQKTAVIMYSTSDENYVRELTMGLGADDFIVKPSSITKLVELLSEMLNRKAMTN